MSTTVIMLPLLLLISATNPFGEATGKFETEFEWTYINFTWPSKEILKSSNYQPGAYIPIGIKVHEPSNRIFISLPRVKSTARITLASIPLNGKRKDPLLTPYPSWKMNEGPNCDTLQDVMSMEIDKQGIMWVIDARRISSATKCPPKIVLFDLNNNNKIVRKYEVPNDLCPHENGCFLNDIVVDGDFAYCSDTTRSDPGIFVYNRVLNKSWKVRNNKTMRGTIEASDFIVQGENFTGVSHINGIALSPSCPTSKYFYYTPQTSFHIYSIPTSILRNQLLSTKNVDKQIRDVIVKSGATGGMVGDSKGKIYLGILPEDSVAVANPKTKSIKVVDQNSDIILWPDTFTFDSKGFLRLSTTQYLRFVNEKMDINEVNFRILKLYTGTKSYFYCDTV